MRLKLSWILYAYFCTRSLPFRIQVSMASRCGRASTSRSCSPWCCGCSCTCHGPCNGTGGSLCRPTHCQVGLLIHLPMLFYLLSESCSWPPIAFRNIKNFKPRALHLKRRIDLVNLDVKKKSSRNLRKSFQRPYLLFSFCYTLFSVAIARTWTSNRHVIDSVVIFVLKIIQNVGVVEVYAIGGLVNAGGHCNWPLKVC